MQAQVDGEKEQNVGAAAQKLKRRLAGIENREGGEFEVEATSRADVERKPRRVRSGSGAGRDVHHYTGPMGCPFSPRA